jgi:hypothetical protein
VGLQQVVSFQEGVTPVDALEIRLEEYKTLRQEILTAMSSRMSILTFGLASISLVLSASISKYTQDTRFGSLFPGLALSAAIPAFAIFILFMWLGEYERMQRAGRFLTTIEEKVNWENRATLLTWETQLREKLGHMAYPYNATVMLLLVISGLSQMGGLLMIFSPPDCVIQHPVVTWLAVALFVLDLHLILYCGVVRKISYLRSASGTLGTSTN